MLPFKDPLQEVKFLREPHLFSEELNIGWNIVETATKYIGYPATNYRGPRNGVDPERGFDCSGFVVYVLLQTKKDFPLLILPDGLRHANEMFDKLGVGIHEDQIKSGDLVFFTRKGFTITHVGIYCGEATDKKRYVIHSPGVDGKRVKLSRLAEEFVPVTDSSQLYSKNPVGYKRLKMIAGNDSERIHRWKQTPI